MRPPPNDNAGVAAGVEVKQVEQADRQHSTPLEQHPFCRATPLMIESDLDALTADIDAHGLRDPITLYQGKILDGRHRYEACMRLGIKPPTVEFKGSEAKARAFVISANVHRRHLSPEQKRSIINAELKRDPKQSDRAIAEKAKVDHKTVGAVRAKAEDGGEIPHHAERVGQDGVKQPIATKSAHVRDFKDIQLKKPSRPPATAAPRVEPARVNSSNETNELAVPIGPIEPMTPDERGELAEWIYKAHAQRELVLAWLRDGEPSGDGLALLWETYRATSRIRIELSREQRLVEFAAWDLTKTGAYERRDAIWVWVEDLHEIAEVLEKAYRENPQPDDDDETESADDCIVSDEIAAGVKP